MTEPTDSAPQLDRPTDVAVGPDEVAQPQDSDAAGRSDAEQTMDTPDELGGTGGTQEGGAG